MRVFDVEKERKRDYKCERHFFLEYFEVLMLFGEPSRAFEIRERADGGLLRLQRGSDDQGDE